MDLSIRLKKLAELADQSVIADIGCDHALVCIEIVSKHRAKKAYACDLRSDPLKQARINIEKAGLSDQIFIRQQNGLEGLPEDVEEILIAGMGGKLMMEILSSHPPKEAVNTLLLSPHKDAPALRRWLSENGWKIIEEHIVEDGHFYPIIKAVRVRKDEKMVLSEKEQEFGVKVIPDEDYIRYLNWSLQKTDQILDHLPLEKRSVFEKRKDQIKSLQNETVLKAKESKKPENPVS